MPPTVHKLLVHSTDVFKFGIVTIGQLTEKAPEAKIAVSSGHTKPENVRLLRRLQNYF